MTPLDREALERILGSIAAIEAYVARTGVDWEADPMAVDAIAKRIEEIGETAKRVTPATLETMPSVDWRGVKGIREVLAHDYDDIEVDLLADVVRENLPGLREAISDALASE
jgi:Uncharacterized conserved protein